MGIRAIRMVSYVCTAFLFATLHSALGLGGAACFYLSVCMPVYWNDWGWGGFVRIAWAGMACREENMV